MKGVPYVSGDISVLLVMSDFRTASLSWLDNLPRHIVEIIHQEGDPGAITGYGSSPSLGGMTSAPAAGQGHTNPVPDGLHILGGWYGQGWDLPRTYVLPKANLQVVKVAFLIAYYRGGRERSYNLLFFPSAWLPQEGAVIIWKEEEETR